MDTKTRAQELVMQMTAAEKASLTSGDGNWYLKHIDRLGQPRIMVTDGPHGLRKELDGKENVGLGASEKATCFPAACATACSFDRALLRRVGEALGEECREQGVSVLLGPGVNIKRSPLCGRNFEYFSEDPLVAGELATALVQGLQSQQVGASLKHFAANNQETRRMTVNAVVDERALRELYLSAFENVVKNAEPWTVMCSYNVLNSVLASENKWLLTDVLRHEWGYTGMVFSDWGAVDDRVAGVRAGLDVEMPSRNTVNDARVLAAAETGTLPELTASAERVSELIEKQRARQPFTFDREKHHQLAREAAASSAVLLKNEDNILPLERGKKLAVIGAFAKSPRYQGAGSSKINPIRVDSAWDAFLAAGFDAVYAAGYDPDSDAVDELLVSEACEKAKNADVAVLFLALPDRFESEGYDRKDIRMPENQAALPARVAAANPNTVVVLQTGAVVDLAWEDSAKALLLSYLGGEATGSAAVDVAVGRVNPSGKLAETWCRELSDNPSYAYFPGTSVSVEYRESVFVGYRYYDAAEKPVRYPFGHGLSYTSFAYGAPTVEKQAYTDKETVRVSVDVRNTGKLDGAEVVQLYVAPPVGALFRPVQELRGFEKVFLKAGEQKRVTFALGARAFSYYHVAARAWAVEPGAYEIHIGASSRDIRGAVTVELMPEAPLAAPDYRAVAACYYDMSNGLSVPDAAFAAVYGATIPPSRRMAGMPHTRNSTLGEVRDRAFGRVFYAAVMAIAKRMFRNDPGMRQMLDGMLDEQPLRAIGMYGGMTPKAVDAIVEACNGRLGRALRALR